MEQKNDTHSAAGECWYGFDLDGTLAKYDKWEGIDHIGEPIAPMVKLIKRMHDEGKTVKIMTARVSPRPEPESVSRDQCPMPEYARGVMQTPDEQSSVECMYTVLKTWGAREFIVDWCLRELGFLPAIVYQKDHLMLELYDDRVKQVIPNMGVLVETLVQELKKQNERLRIRLIGKIHAEEGLLIRLWFNRIFAFLIGSVSVLITLVLLEFFVLDADESEKVTAARELHDAACRYLRVTREPLFEKIQKDNLTPASGL